jgi:hypothetical protein
MKVKTSIANVFAVNPVTRDLKRKRFTVGSKFKVYKFELGLWIRIWIGSGFSDFVYPDPYWESGSRIRIQGQEN